MCTRSRVALFRVRRITRRAVALALAPHRCAQPAPEGSPPRTRTWGSAGLRIFNSYSIAFKVTWWWRREGKCVCSHPHTHVMSSPRALQICLPLYQGYWRKPKWSKESIPRWELHARKFKMADRWRHSLMIAPCHDVKGSGLCGCVCMNACTCAHAHTLVTSSPMAVTREALPFC